LQGSQKLGNPTTQGVILKDLTPYQRKLQLAGLWHVRLGYIGLRLLKKTTKLTSGLPNLDKVKEEDFFCLACTQAKAIRRPSKRPIADPLEALNSIKGDTFKINPTPYNKYPIVLPLVDRKTYYR